MNRVLVNTKRNLKDSLRNCKVYHPIVITQHFVERAVERNINPFKLAHILNFAISRYSFLLIYDQTFALKYTNEFVVIGEFKDDKYLLKTVLTGYMNPEANFKKTLKPM